MARAKETGRGERVGQPAQAAWVGQAGWIMGPIIAPRRSRAKVLGELTADRPSLVAERHDGIDSGGTPGRAVAGGERHQADHEGVGKSGPPTRA